MLWFSTLALNESSAACTYLCTVDKVRADIRKIVFTNQEMLGFTKISRVRKLVVLQYIAFIARTFGTNAVIDVNAEI